MSSDYVFINKAAFFPKQGILAVGDLHLGYEYMMIKHRISLPESQIEEMHGDLEEIFTGLKERGHEPKKIIFLGDIKHFFGYEYREGHYFRELSGFLDRHFFRKDVILIRGNHDKFDPEGKKMEDYHVEDGIIFLHGHAEFPEIHGKDVRTIVTGHLHPSVVISDRQNVKREKFKCFLVGKLRGKETIVLPSFFDVTEGSSVNDYDHDYNSNSIIPQGEIMEFEVFVIGEEKVYNFGKIGDLK